MPDPTDIPNWRRLDPRVTTSGQLDEAQLELIRALGVQHVVNLGLHDHPKALPHEAASVAARGMAYIHIPVDFAAPTEEDFGRFCTALATVGDAPVHIHCIANLRVSAFLYRYQRDVLGHKEAEARAMMDTLWQPGGAWAAFIGDAASVDLPHRGPRLES
jgi:protein tyrosine phosphatase (PTP) superfamily phosphohydrolase (DUF442 family)